MAAPLGRCYIYGYGSYYPKRLLLRVGTTKRGVWMSFSGPQPVSFTPKVLYFRKPSQIPGIPAASARTLDAVAEHFAFRANDYYLGLIDWDDPADPIRRLVMRDPA